MVCPNCQTENSPDARFCIACGQPLPLVCPRCGSLNPAVARFCNQCGLPLEGLATVTAPPLGDGSALVPPVEPIESDEQRRVVTILFADLISSTALADGMDPEDVRTLLAGFFTGMAREIRRHGGTVEKYIGDAVMAVFGLPVTHEDDPLRAVRAALDMQATLRQLNVERQAAEPGSPELAMRIGIDTGDVAASISASEGGDFLVTGDAVNVAARLQQLAPPGGILVGPRTRRGTTGAVKYRALPAEVLRGKSRATRVWEVVELLDAGAAPVTPSHGDGLSAPLVGRETELNVLDSMFSRVLRERRPALVTILGAPGIGKTRLARESIRRMLATPAPPVFAPLETVGASSGRGSRRATAAVVERGGPLVLEGRCPSYGEGIAYWPLAQMLRTWAGFNLLTPAGEALARLSAGLRQLPRLAVSGEDIEKLAATLGHTIGITTKEARPSLMAVEGAQTQETTFRAWRLFFEALADDCGLIVLVEDVAWADELLLQLLEHVAERASGVPLLVLCTARPELLERRPDWGGGKRNYAMITLDPLDEDEMRTLVSLLLPGEKVPKRLREGITDKVEGNPFFAEETLRMLLDRGMLVHGEGGGWQVAPDFEASGELADPAIPDTVQGVLLARIDLLSLVERDVLQHASVFGRYYWASALTAVATHLAEVDLAAVLRALQGRDLIRVSEHARASIAPADEPVYTFNHALIREVVYGTIVRTRRAQEHARVAEVLEQMAGSRVAGISELLAWHYHEYYIQGNIYRSRNATKRAAVREKVLGYLTLAGDESAARYAPMPADRFYSDAIALLVSDGLPADLPRRVDLLIKRAHARANARHFDDAWGDYHDALDLWASRPMSDMDEEQAQRWRWLGVSLYTWLVLLPTRTGGVFSHRPRREQLLSYLGAAHRLADEAGRHDTAEYAALLTAQSFFWWSWPERRGERELLDALRGAREAVRIQEELGNAHEASEALDALGNVLAATTDLRGYMESQLRRLDWAEQIKDPNELVDIHSEVSLAAELSSDFSTAIRHGEQALAIAHQADSAVLGAQALRSLVLAYVECDHYHAALEFEGEYRESLSHSRKPGSGRQAWAMLALALAAMRLGQIERAEEIIERARARTLGRVRHDERQQYIELLRARLALERGLQAEAKRIMLDAEALRSGRFILAALLAELTELSAREGDRETYDRFAAQAQELGWRSGARKALAQTIRARAIVAIEARAWDDALADIASALQSYEDLGTHWEEGRTRYLMAGLYRQRRAAGDAEREAAELARALELFQEVGAVGEMARVRAAMGGGEIDFS